MYEKYNTFFTNRFTASLYHLKWTACFYYWTSKSETFSEWLLYIVPHSKSNPGWTIQGAFWDGGTLRQANVAFVTSKKEGFFAA